MQLIKFSYRPNIFGEEVEDVYLNVDDFSHFYSSGFKTYLVTKSKDEFELIWEVDTDYEFISIEDAVRRVLQYPDEEIINLAKRYAYE